MITICHLGVSQSDRIVWLMEELGLPYKLDWYDRGENFMSQDDFQSLHPVASAPIIIDGDLVLPESVAIVEYISHRYGEGKLSVDPSAENYPHYMYWMQLNNRVQNAFITKMAAGEQPEGSNPLLEILGQRELKYFQYLDDRLADNEYLAGSEFSNADIMAMFPLTMLPQMSGVDLSGYKHIGAYLERIGQRPAYQKAMALAGPTAQRPE